LGKTRTRAKGSLEASSGPPNRESAPPGTSRWRPGSRTIGRIPLSILLLAVLGFLLRVAHVLASRQNPFFAFLRADSGAYDRWGQKIAAGEWVGHGIFYQDPLYPYFLGVFYACFGHHLVALLVVQSFLGSLNVLLLWGIASRLWGSSVGIVTAVLAALYAPFWFYDGLVLKTFLEVLLLNASLLVLVVSSEASNRNAATRHGLLAGALLALGTLARANYLVLVPLLLGWLIYLASSAAGRESGAANEGGEGGERRESRRKRDRRVAGGVLRPLLSAPPAAAGLGLLLGLALVLLPVLVRNRVVGHDWVLTTSQAGQNFFIGNNPENTRGTYVQPSYVRPDPQHEQEDFLREAERRAGHSLLPSQASRYWFRAALDHIAAHPGRTLALDLRKLGLLLHRYEVPDNEDFPFWSRYSPWLRLNPLRFGILGPLALVGLVLGWSRRRDLSLLYLVLGGYLLSVTLFFVLGRYRLPAVSLLLIFAAGALVEIAEAIRRSRRGTLLLAAVALVPALVIVHYPEAEERGPMTPEMYTNLGAAYLEAGRPPEALAAQREAVRLAPDWADARYNLGATLYKAGERDAAMGEFRRTVRLYPDYEEAWFHLGLLLKEQGRLVESADTLRRALDLQPENALYLFTLARVTGELGRREETRALLQRLYRLDDPEYSTEGRIVEARLRAAEGDTLGATTILREYLRLRPTSPLRSQVEALLHKWEGS
jgi:tetratricopeptide (TPR) repeat protein